MNSFMNNLKDTTNYTYTENGALTHKTTKSDVYDMFAVGGAYRNRTDQDCILLFKNALEENEELALKCLFYLRDIRGGQGERRFFRVCYKWLCNNHPDAAQRNLDYIAEYGRWDDLIYIAADTQLQSYAFDLIGKQLRLDLDCVTPSLLAKWMPSENTSSTDTKEMANKIRKHLKISHKAYRKMLSTLRKRINVLERLMSANRWEEIEFDKIPSKAGMKYKNAFARRDLIAEKYKEFAQSDAKVNAKTLYPYDIAHEAFKIVNEKKINYWDYLKGYDEENNWTERLMLQKYWDNLPNYYGDKNENGLAIVDVSGSMTGRPMEAAVSLGAYIAEKAHGPFANHFVTFSEHPKLVKFEGVDIVDKFNRAQSADWGYNTNISAVFAMLLRIAQDEGVKAEDIPQRLYIFSDMEFDAGFGRHGIAESGINTLLENIALQWNAAGYELPTVIFWNLDARQNNIPMLKGRFAYISGLSPVMIEQVLSGKDGYDLMLEKLVGTGRYKDIK